MKKSELVKIILEVVKQENVLDIKAKSIENKIEQAQDMLKIYEDQQKTYEDMAKHAEDWYKEKQYPELKKDADMFKNKAQEKANKCKQIQDKIKTLQDSLKGDKKKLDEEKNKTFGNYEDNSIPVIAIDSDGKETKFNSRSEATRKLFLDKKAIDNYFRYNKKNPVTSSKTNKSYTFKNVSLKKEGKIKK